MTLHASKGLEFPAVILCGVSKGTLPLETEKEAADIEEERAAFLCRYDPGQGGADPYSRRGAFRILGGSAGRIQ